MQALSEEITDLEKKFDESNRKLKDIDDKLQAVQDILGPANGNDPADEKAIKDLQELTGKHDAETSTYKKISSAIAEKRELHDTTNKNFISETKSLLENKNRLKELGQEIDLKNKALEEQSTAVSNSSDSVEKLKSELNTITKSIENYKLVSNSEDIDKKIRSLENGLGGLNVSKSNQLTEINKHKNSRSSAEQMLEKLNQEYSNAKVTLQTLQAEAERQSQEKDTNNAHGQSTGETERSNVPSAENTESDEQSAQSEQAKPADKLETPVVPAVPAPPAASSDESAASDSSIELDSSASRENPELSLQANPENSAKPGNLVQPQYNYVAESASQESYVPQVAAEEEQESNENVAQKNPAVQPAVQSAKPAHAVAAKATVSEAAQAKQSSPVENKTVEDSKADDSKVSEDKSVDDNNKETEEAAKEVDEKISDTVSENPKAQASATSESKSSGNMLSTIMLGALGVLTLTGAAAAGVTVMRHRRLPRA